MRVNTFGCQIAQVAVDPDTGEIEVERIVAVHDIGRVLNPLTALEPGRGRHPAGRSASRSWRSASSTRRRAPSSTAGSRTTSCRRSPTAPRSSSELHRRARPAPVDDGREGPRRAADHPDRRRGRERRRGGDRRARPRGRRSRASASSRCCRDARLRAPRRDSTTRSTLLAAGDALALAGGTDVVPLRATRQARSGNARRRAPAAAGRRSSPTATGCASAPARRSRPSPPTPRVADGYAALHQAAVGGGLAAAAQRRHGRAATSRRHVRCWYFRHPDLTCWLNGGDTCYAQIGDHRKHGLEAGRLHLGRAVRSRGAARARSARGSSLRGPGGERERRPARSLRASREDHGARRCSSRRAS